MRNRWIALGPIAADGRRPVTVREWLGRALRVLRTIIGVPDYDRYAAHMRAHHPGCELVTRDEFMNQRLASRYSQPGSRCC
jgi:uncharacterized short protein YbdD (DUF466 family)